MTEHVVIVGAARTAIGSFGGSLSGETPAALGAKVAAEALKRAKVEADQVGHVVFGKIGRAHV